MFSLGALTFLTPWILAALAAVPVIWWLMRVMPPQPKTVLLPTYFLLKDLKADIKTAAHTPWWLLLLRSLIVIFFILALADPIIKMSEGLPGKGGSVLLIVDNGWSSAINWDKRQEKIYELLPRITRSGRTVVVLPTAPTAQEGKVQSFGPTSADEARDFIQRLQPQPWPADHAAARKIIPDGISYAVFFSDGLADRPADTKDMLVQSLSGAGGLLVVNDDDINAPVILRRLTKKPGELAFLIERRTPSQVTSNLMLQAFAEEGQILDEIPVSFAADALLAEITWNMPQELRSKAARFALRSPLMSSAVYMTDTQWRQRPAGILAGPAQKDNPSFLNEVYYLRRALEGNGVVSVETPDVLLSRQLSAVIWPDSAPVTPVDRVALVDWVEQGGFLIRFSGPNLAAEPEDPLLPVPLRYGQRAMEGSMTWEKPIALGTVPEGSPFIGLDVPQDVTVTRQVLATPSPEVFEKTWLSLEDGTPLITGATYGKGYIVLVHTTAGPDWSNFCYSGLFVESLKRMISLSTGIGDYKASILLQPLMVQDAFGRLQTPDASGMIRPIDPKVTFIPSPASPPGLYGDEGQFQVMNLGNALPQMQVLDALPVDALQESYGLTGEKSKKPDFFKWALLLLLIDVVATLFLRGVLLPVLRSFVFLAILFSSFSAQAQEGPEDTASSLYLAYMETGDQDTDSVSYNGLSGLAEMINARTTIKIKGVKGVNPDIDDLFYYPFIYWPMTEAQDGISTTAARHIQNYLGRGGMIVFDTRDRQFGDVNGETIGTRKLRELTADIRIPELMRVPDNHILTKSFYLLNNFPGLYAGGKVWVEREPSPNYDAVTSVIIGENDWAAAWSRNASDRNRFMVAPGGEQQREMAYRTGINIVMIALAGNYKADQVHIPYILERIGR